MLVIDSCRWDAEGEPVVTFASYQHDLVLKVLREKMVG